VGQDVDARLVPGDEGSIAPDLLGRSHNTFRIAAFRNAEQMQT
jgi:hypothetical protein